MNIINEYNSRKLSVILKMIDLFNSLEALDWQESQNLNYFVSNNKKVALSELVKLTGYSEEELMPLLKDLARSGAIKCSYPTITLDGVMGDEITISRGDSLFESLNNIELEEVNNLKERNEGPINHNGKEERDKIKTITFIEDSQTKKVSKFYINNSKEETKPINNLSSQIKKLALLSKGEDVDFDRQALDYLNFNKRCALYCNGQYSLTKIVERKSNLLCISSKIKCEVITERAYKIRIGNN